MQHENFHIVTKAIFAMARAGNYAMRELLTPSLEREVMDHRGIKPALDLLRQRLFTQTHGNTLVTEVKTEDGIIKVLVGLTLINDKLERLPAMLNVRFNYWIDVDRMEIEYVSLTHEPLMENGMAPRFSRIRLPLVYEFDRAVQTPTYRVIPAQMDLHHNYLARMALRSLLSENLLESKWLSEDAMRVVRRLMANLAEY